MKKLIFVFAFSFLSLINSCASCTASETKPEAIILVPEATTQFKIWSQNRSVALAKEMGIPNVSKIEIVNTPASVISFNDVTGVVIWQVGYYDEYTRTIRIWVMDPIGSYIPLDRLESALHHEFLHHYYSIKNVVTPLDHNQMFLDKIHELGWDKEGN